MAASPHSWDFLLPRLRELRLPLSRETRRIASNDLERRRPTGVRAAMKKERDDLMAVGPPETR